MASTRDARGDKEAATSCEFWFHECLLRFTKKAVKVRVKNKTKKSLEADGQMV